MIRLFKSYRDTNLIRRYNLLSHLKCLRRGQHDWKPVKYVDYSVGPGWMADVYEGSQCRCCGRLKNIRKVY